MGGQISKGSEKTARRIIWCDTEGGVRNVALWDVTFIEETVHGIAGYRLSNVNQATKRGQAMLRKELSPEVYTNARKTGSTVVTTFSALPDSFAALKVDAHIAVDVPLQKLVASYFCSRADSIVVAWNMNGHDKHVLRRAAGNDIVDKVTLWDALPWFRAAYTLPKNTMASSKAGTPRALFSVPVFGPAHSSLSDAAHLRQVVLRASYCRNHDAEDISAYTNGSATELFAAACKQIEESNVVKEWALVSTTAWIPGLVPDSVRGT